MNKATLSLVFLLALSPAFASAGAPRDLLTNTAAASDLQRTLVPREKWHPYPTIDDRTAWEVVPQDIRQSWIKAGERYLHCSWDALPATVFLEFVRDGNRSNFERLSFARRRKLATLVLAEVFENQGRFVDDIANGVWAICEESYWGVPAHVGMQSKGSGLPDITEPTVDLFSAETGSLLAWTLYLTGDRLGKVSPLIPERIYLEAERRILKPNLERNDFWWMGLGERKDLNNWTPWICSNWLTVALILERDETLRRKAVEKNLLCLDQFLNIYPEDGGCDEGPGYWGRAGASLFDCLTLLQSATAGSFDLFRNPLIQKIGQFIYKVYIKDDYFVNFADASARLSPEGGLIYRYGKRINDPVMVGFGAFLAQRRASELHEPEAGSLGRVLPDLFVAGELRSATPREPLLGQAWLPDLQVMTARSQPNSSEGFYVAAKGGNNAESHNHNDVGNFVVYRDGKPVLVDAGVGTYTSKTFSSKRYEIWTMQSAYHNLPTVNGVMQKDGAQYRAREVRFVQTPQGVRFSLDLAGAYPPEAQLESWNRALTLRRDKGLELEEHYRLRQFKEPVRLNFMTPLHADASQPGRVTLSDQEQGSAQAVIRYDPSQFKVDIEDVPLTDDRLQRVWGDRLMRVVLTRKDDHLENGYRIEITKP